MPFIMRAVMGLATVCAASIATAGFAQSGQSGAVAISRAVFVERIVAHPSGTATRTIEPADRLRSGDRVVLMLEWANGAASTGDRGFTLSSAVPDHLAYASGGPETQISADGGRSWGRLGTLRVRSRLAVAQDVTHIRWRIAAGRPSGRVSYGAVVRR